MEEKEFIRGGARNMSYFHKEQLIEAFMQVCTMEQRSFLMREVPVAYNDYCGGVYVKTIRNNGDPA